jgi:hypothetical protein
MRRLRAVTFVGTMSAAVLGTSSAFASATVTIDGDYSFANTRPAFQGCPSNVGGDECRVLDLRGLGLADLVYVYGQTFEPAGPSCFDVDGTFTLTLRSDGSTISGPSTGRFCRPGSSGVQRGGPSFGNPQNEHDSIDLADGSGQFAGLHGTVAYAERSSGAHFEGTLQGTLSD